MQGITSNIESIVSFRKREKRNMTVDSGAPSASSERFVAWKDLCQNYITQDVKTNGSVTRFTAPPAGGDKTALSGFEYLTAQLENQGNLASGIPTPAGGAGNGLSAAPAAASASETGPAPPVARAAGPLSEDNLLVLGMKYKEWDMNAGLAAYGNSDAVMLPLGGVAASLDFNIHVDDELEGATGWFISEDRHFSMDLKKNEVTVAGTKKTLPAGMVIRGDDDIYVDSKTLGQWFPVDFNIRFSEMTVDVAPREKLAFQEKLDREQKRDDIRAGGGRSEATLPLAEMDYKPFSMPFADVSLNTTVSDSRKKDPEVRSNYSVLAQGDMAYMTSNIYLNGNDENGVDNLRMKLERTDPEGGLLGPLGASRYAMGDVESGNFPILGYNDVERGFSITNGDINRSYDFDTTRFEGNLSPGWEVEVYRNDNLIDSEVVGSGGRYDFEEPIYYGNNDFKLVFYGPQGQRREETKRVTIGEGMLKKGDDQYRLSLTQKGTQTVDSKNLTDVLDRGSVRAVAQFERGLTENLSVGTGVSSVEIEGERHNYLNLGLRGSAAGIFGKADYLYDTQGGHAVELSALTTLGPLSVRARQELYSDFITEETYDNTSPVKAVTEVSARGTIPSTRITPDLPFTVALKDIDRENSHQTELSNRLSTRLGGVSLSNIMTATFNDDAADETTVEGSFQASGRLGPTYLRGSLDYDLGPEIKATAMEISDYWRLNDSLSAEVKLKHDLGDVDRTTVSSSLNWDTGKVTVSPRVSYDSEGNFSGFVSANFSLGKEPRSNRLDFSSRPRSDSGAVSAMVFHDRNNNKVFDADDRRLEGVEVRAPQAGRDLKTDENGVAFLTGLPKFKTTDIEVNRGTLEDPFHEPSGEGNSILPRPGGIQEIDIPVITVGEIDGTLYTQTADGRKKRAVNAQIQLVDASGEVVQTVKSEYDGFYLFMKVPPGPYTVRVNPEDTHYGHLSSEARQVSIGMDGDVTSGMDIVLNRPTPMDAIQKRPQRVATGPVPETSGMIAAEIEEREIPGVNFHKAVQSGGQRTEYGVHLSSFRTRAGADRSIKELRQKHGELLGQAQFSVRPVDLGDKGTWFRVVAGSFANREEAKDLGIRLKGKGEYTRVLVSSDAAPERTGTAPVTSQAAAPVDDGKEKFGVHLSSFRTRAEANRSILELKEKHGDLLGAALFSIRKVELGSKGTWFRVMAGSFEEKGEAERLGGKLKLRNQYASVMPEEQKPAYGIHLASFRTREMAGMGIRELQEKHRALLGAAPFSTTRVDLGPKGVWFRVSAGSFENRDDAKTLGRKLELRKQYAQVRPSQG